LNKKNMGTRTLKLTSSIWAKVLVKVGSHSVWFGLSYALQPTYSRVLSKSGQRLAVLAQDGEGQ
jgi:hypothetical protein